MINNLVMFDCSATDYDADDDNGDDFDDWDHTARRGYGNVDDYTALKRVD